MTNQTPDRVDVPALLAMAERDEARRLGALAQRLATVKVDALQARVVELEAARPTSKSCPWMREHDFDQTLPCEW